MLLLIVLMSKVSDADSANLSMCTYEPEAAEAAGATRLLRRPAAELNTGRGRAGAIAHMYRLRPRLNPMFLEKKGFVQNEKRQIVLCGAFVIHFSLLLLSFIILSFEFYL